MEHSDDPPVATGGNDGDPPDGADMRIAKLEVHVENIQSVLGDIRSELRGLASSLSHLPTKQDLFTNAIAVVVIGLTVIVITVGGIIGGLDFIKRDDRAPAAAAVAAPAPAPQPIVIQVPYPAQKRH